MTVMRRRALTIAAVSAGALAAPAAAQAASYSVAPSGGTCGGADRTCENLVEAAKIAATGDQFDVAPGTYAGATFAAPNITIAGPSTGGVVVNSTLTFSGGGAAPSTISRLGVAQTSGTDPAVNVTGTGGLVVADSIVASSGGNGITFNEGTANKVQRSTVFTGRGDAISVVGGAASVNAKALTVDSTVVTGGAAGIAVRNANKVAGGAVTLDVHHVTASGSSESVVLDASQAGILLGNSGSITGTLNDSILLNGVRTTNNTGVAGVGANTVTANRNRTIETGDNAALFVNAAKGNFRLRSGSPAIGKGGFTAGESATDFNGDAINQTISDVGADQFRNAAPVAGIGPTSTTGRQNRPLTFNATGSSDSDGAIAEYRWSFGDGTSAVTSTPTVQHAYKDEGTRTATLTVADRDGGVSAPATSAPVRILDGIAPLVSVDKPTANQSIRLVSQKTRKRAKIAFSGRALDKSGVSKIILSIRQISRATTTKKKKAKSSAKQCRWLSPNKGMVVRSCTKPVQITAKLKGTKWTYTVPTKRRLTAGSWEIAAAGVDKTGAFGNSFAKGKVKFRLK